MILNYGTADDVLELIESLCAVSYTRYHVVVIDNASPDDSVSVLKKRLPSTITLIANTENNGFAGGNNVGIRYALEKGADYCLLLNPDTVVHERFLDELISVAENPRAVEILAMEHKGVTPGMWGPRILYYDLDAPPTKAQSNIVYFDGGALNAMLTEGRPQNYRARVADLKRSKPFVCDYVTGAALLVSREVIEQIGLIPEEYFLYYEDTEWNIRAHRAGYASVTVPASIIWHKESRSTKKFSYNYLYYLTRNGYFLAMRNGNLWQRSAAYPFSFFKFLKQPIKWILIPSKRSFVKPIMRATFDFWRHRMGQRS